MALRRQAHMINSWVGWHLGGKHTLSTLGWNGTRGKHTLSTLGWNGTRGKHTLSTLGRDGT